MYFQFIKKQQKVSQFMVITHYYLVLIGLLKATKLATICNIINISCICCRAGSMYHNSDFRS